MILRYYIKIRFTMTPCDNILHGFTELEQLK